MKAYKKIVAITGEYTNAQGEKKKRYATVGTLFEDGNKLSIKLDCVPVGPDFSGWLNCYDLDDGKKQQSAPAQTPMMPGPPADDKGDDIPW